jgi:ribosomal subunit interface protein
MLLRISGQNVKISSDFKAYVAQKAAGLAKYYHNLDSVTVTLRRGTNGSAIARIIAGGKRRHRFVAQEAADNAYGSINRAARDLERQLTKAKSRRNRKHTVKPVMAYEIGLG